MSRTIPLQDSVVYGPVRSRRLGVSLGINVLPVSRKVCSSDCVYCQYGWTPSPAVRSSGPRTAVGGAASGVTAGGGGASAERLRRAPELLAEIGEDFRHRAQEGLRVDCITLAGNGEPTLHPDLLDLVLGIRRLRDLHFSGASVGILSDATQLARPPVRRALALLDARYMKFDAADEAMWRRLNKPLAPVRFEEMLEGLRTLPGVVLQSMFVQGSVDNTGEPHLRAWVEAVAAIRPRSVQVYTIDRGTADPGITEVPRATLEAIAGRLTAATGIPADVYD